MVFDNLGSWLGLGFSNLRGVFGNRGLSPTLTFGISSGSLGLESGSNHSPNSLISILPFQ